MILQPTQAVFYLWVAWALLVLFFLIRIDLQVRHNGDEARFIRELIFKSVQHWGEPDDAVKAKLMDVIVEYAEHVGGPQR